MLVCVSAILVCDIERFNRNFHSSNLSRATARDRFRAGSTFKESLLRDSSELLSLIELLRMPIVKSLSKP